MWHQGNLYYFVTARTHTGVLAACMAVMYYPEDKEFVFSHLVTHELHRQQGLAKGIIKASVPFLKATGLAVRIRNHKRMNVIPEKYFLDLGFTEKLLPFKQRWHKEYKLRYILDI